VPLDFLKRRGGGGPATKGSTTPEPARAAVPEEAVAEDHQLRLTFGAKTSVGVRLQGGPQILGALPQMVNDVAITPVEVV